MIRHQGRRVSLEETLALAPARRHQTPGMRARPGQASAGSRGGQKPGCHTETRASARACGGCQQRKKKGASAQSQTQTVGEKHQPPPPASSLRGGVSHAPSWVTAPESEESGARDES